MDMGGSGGGGGIISSPGSEDDKLARRRSRRVSFADTTAVRVFDRDEDFATPPEEREPGSASPSPSPARSSAERENGDDTEESPRPPVFFLPDIESSSPGSATGSIASTDGGNFFGPVSTSFIQTGRPSDSGMSEDDNHDITMDSKTFSMYYRNIAPPEDCTANSAASLMTPDMASKGHLKELTISDPGRTSNSGRTDMSLLTGNSRSYNYGKLSHTLNSMLKEVKAAQQTESPKAGIADVTPDSVLTLSASEEENREENLCNGNGISSDELGTVDTITEHTSMSNPVSNSTCLIQEDNEMVIDGHENSQSGNDDHMVIHPCVDNTVEPPAKLSSARKSFVNNVDSQSHCLHQSLLKDQPSGSNCITNASQLSTAAPATSLMNAEQLHQQNEVMDRETVLHTPRTVGQQLQVPQGSISSLRLKRQKLFSATPLSNSKVASQEACSLSSEFDEHGKTISAPRNALKTRLQESPAAFRLPFVEKNELSHQANDMFRNTEDHDSTLSVSSISVPRQQLKKTNESCIIGTPLRQGLNEATKVQETSCHALTLDSQSSHDSNPLLDLVCSGRKRTVKENDHAVQEHPEEIAKAARSPRKLRKELPCVPQSSLRIQEKQNGAYDDGQLVNVDWNKVLSTISNATEHVLSAFVSKLNLQQLDVLSDKLDEIHMARKYKRLSAAVRIKDLCDDKQKRLEEARSLHEKLFYEKAKLQINNMKLAKLKNKAQLCQDGIQECCVLKSEILGAAQMKDSCLPAETSMNSSEKQELAILTKKRVELNDVQQKVENLRSSLECFRNIEGDISCDSVMKHAEEQLKMRNQCHLIHQQAGLCELNDIVKRDNKRDLILNYHNLLFQRIILNTSGMSNTFVNNSLNGTRIEQTFPNLDASVAFNFVFKAEESQRVCDLQSLQKMTMETSLLLGNLIDVLEEIKLAKMELLNLTSAAFVLESQTCQLGLRVCFMSFKSSKKFAFIIDMTDLNCSVYPSDPSELLIKVCEAQTTLAQASVDETMASIRNLQPGRTVILRLCRMVSRLIHSLPR
ncbi:unnamed protein product [Urochloa humidicola]